MFRPDAQLPAETALYFADLAAQLRRDIIAMRDSNEPSRFDQVRLEYASRHFDEAFAALDAAIPRDQADDR